MCSGITGRPFTGPLQPHSVKGGLEMLELANLRLLIENMLSTPQF